MAAVFGPNIELPGAPGAPGQYGNLVLSKLPILRSTNTPLEQVARHCPSSLPTASSSASA